jgi:hypothetical protein
MIVSETETEEGMGFDEDEEDGQYLIMTTNGIMLIWMRNTVGADNSHTVY